MSEIHIRTLSEQESRLLNSLSVEGKRVFASSDARAVFGCERVNVNKLLSRLVQKRWLARLEKGKYLILPLEAGMEGDYTLHEFALAAHLLEPYAIAYWSALHFHGFTEQVLQTVFIASPKGRKDVAVEELGLHCRFVKVKDYKFFGIQPVWLEEHSVNVTDPTKTIVDCLDHPELCGGIVEATKGLYYYAQHREAAPERLTEYAVRMNNRTIFKRLGYLAETLHLLWHNHIEAWRAQISAGFSLLDPRQGHRGPYNTRWNLRLNVDTYRLIEWLEH